MSDLDSTSSTTRRQRSHLLSRVTVAFVLAVPLAGALTGTSSAAPGEPGGQAATAGSNDGAHRAEPASPPAQQRQGAEPAAKRQDAQPPAKQQETGKDQPAGPTAGGSGTSGDTSQSQPLSRADQHGTGANTGDPCDHAYCSTRDGSASENGNGDGAATGQPCAGCVGKADNKNPHGQSPDGNDRNAGYECDRNSGIARGNPAHTGCITAAGLPPTDVLPKSLIRTPMLPDSLFPAVRSAAFRAPTATQPQTLPSTGASTVAALPAAGGLLVLGLALVAAGRRPADPAAR